MELALYGTTGHEQLPSVRARKSSTSRVEPQKREFSARLGALAPAACQQVRAKQGTSECVTQARGVGRRHFADTPLHVHVLASALATVAVLARAQ
eukprot:8951074-Lingulodinium_polyedra.AAC.1